MKSRFLLLRFFVLLLGITAFCSYSTSYAGNPDGEKLSAERMQQIRANQNTGDINASDMLRAREQTERMASQKATVFSDLNWNQIGPNNAAGRTRTLLFSNKDASGNTILTGGVSGGIWKSRNLGLTWHQMNTQDNEVLRVTSMVQTTGGTVYVSTGESYCGTNRYAGSGIYRSDNDSVFTLLPNTRPVMNDTASDWSYITKLALSPTGRIFAATNTGLKYSDNGSDWFVAKSGRTRTVEIGPDGTILANIDNAAYIAAGGDVNNFVSLSTGSPTAFPNTGVSGMSFAIAPSDANVMYASLVNASGGLLNVYKSTDRGTSWFIVFPGNSTYDPLGGSGCYANSLAVFPGDPNQLLFGGMTIWHGEKYQETGYYNWEQVAFAGIIEESYLISDQLVPLSQHQLVFRPGNPSQFGTATDDGISIGTIRSSGYSFQHLIRNLIISQFNSVSYSMNEAAAIGGAVYVGAEWIPGGNTLNEPMSGRQLSYGFGGDVAWSMINPNTVFYATGSITAQPWARSDDLGVSESPTFMGTLLNAGYSIGHLWEDFNWNQGIDSVQFIATEGPIAQDSTFLVPSANGKFPIHYQTPVAIPANDTM
jgi:hypothetical protein